MNSQAGVGTTLTDRPTARPIAFAISSAPRSSGPGTVALPGVRAGSSKAATATRAMSRLKVARYGIAVHQGKMRDVRKLQSSRRILAKKAWLDDRMRDSGNRRKQPIDAPVLGGHKRRMRGSPAIVRPTMCSSRASLAATVNAAARLKSWYGSIGGQ